MDVSQTAKLSLPIPTARLQLAALRREDAPALRDIVTAPAVGRMLFMFPADWSVEAAEVFVDQTQFTGGWPFRCGIYEQKKLIGSVGVGDGAAPPIFYFLDPSVGGKGYATEAVAAFCAFLFGLGCPALTADVFHDNAASMRVLGKVGFRKTGEGIGHSAARLEPAPVSLYRLEPSDLKASP